MLLICLILSISCKKEKIYQEKYKIGVQNNYFEAIDSVKIGEQTLKNPIPIGEEHFFKEMFLRAKYEVIFYTSSQLIIKSDFQAVSYQHVILLMLKDNGRIEIQ
ncbi:hypothetical protein ACI76O_01885 [Capnocytophaga cynodegmi]|uniref:hypothetical protein n=1 Tax=Capnocytophaga cynodegmi TaxID=28189 RepID=UPI00385AEFB3